MKKFLAVLLVMVLVPVLIWTYYGLHKDSPQKDPPSTKRNFTLYSPLRRLRIDIELDESGALSCSAADGNGLSLLGKSEIGIMTEECDFSTGLALVEKSKTEIVDESYSCLSGKKSRVRNYRSETLLTFEKDRYYFDVYFRAYEDGLAYRFGIRTRDHSPAQLTVVSETGTFSLPGKSEITAELVDSVDEKFCYENEYATVSVESLSPNSPPYICFPALVSVADERGEPSGKYLLLSEADLIGSGFYGSVLSVKGGNVLGMHPAPKASERPAVITTDFLSPWRFGVYGEPGDIAVSDMAENLAAEPEGDYSWVEPGVTAWMWIAEKKKGQRNPATIRDYINLASQMGWKYLTLDEGWQPDSTRPDRAYQGYFSWFDKTVEYAESKGVGLIVWIKYTDLDTPEEREALRELAAKGVKGIKADFFDSEDQATLADMNEIFRLCAECHLIVNCHGAGKPTGERRTYPHVINREAVFGEEYYKRGYVNDAVNWAYTRTVLGPTDLTPRVYPYKYVNTPGVQLAECVIVEAGTPCMAGDTLDYRNNRAASFYKNLPAAWDDTVFIDGAVGEYVSLARRSGDDWYAAAITKDARQGMTLPLRFLGEGEYEAVIYSDKNRYRLNIMTRTVTRYDILSFDMLDNSGYAVRLIKKNS